MRSYFGHGKYILTTTAKQKNGRRHIARRSDDFNELKEAGLDYNPKYIVEIYDSRWNLIERIK